MEKQMNTIGWAVKEMHNGEKVRRAGWNGKGMWLQYVSSGWSGPALPGCPIPADCESAPFIAMKTADNKFVPWLCSQTDLLATDWELA